MKNISKYIDLIMNLAITIPFLYLFIIYIVKNKKIRKVKIGHYLIAIFLLIFILLIRNKVSTINTYNNKNNEPTTNNKTTTTKPIVPSTTTVVNNDDDNDNYIKTTSKGYILEKIDGAYYIDDYLIVNKSYPLSEDWLPKNPKEKIETEICKNCIDKTAYEEWIKMKNDAAAIGLNIYISSGYRAYNYQKGLYQHFINKGGAEYADITSARAGHSEHQSGFAFDLNSVDASFTATSEGKWVNDNAHLYGFIIRYPKDKTHETGYKYESWHLRYVGKYLADKLYNNGNWITMEAYFGLESKYS